MEKQNKIWGEITAIDDDCHLWLFNIEYINNEKICLFNKWLIAEELQKAQSYKIFDDKKRYIIARAMLRYLSFAYYGILKDEFIDYNQHGKPYFKNQKNFYFNISHSKNYIALAFAKSDLGVDVQFFEGRNFLSLAKYAFHHSEYDFLLKSTEQKKDFYKIWTIKEAVIKAIGSGLFIDSKSFDITENQQKMNDWNMCIVNTKQQNYTILYQSFFLNNNYSYAVARNQIAKSTLKLFHYELHKFCAYFFTL